MPSFTPNFNYTLPTPFGDANIWGTELNTNISAQDTYLNSAANTFIGNTAPSTPAIAAGRLWVNNTGSTWPLSIYDGTSWVSIGTLDPTSHEWTPSGVPTLTGLIAIQTFTTSGTYTPTANMVQAVIEIVGGGGGGGGSFGVGAGGGGGGEYAKGLFSAATIGASQTVTIGAAGTGGPNPTSNGTNGGTSSVGSLITAVGGSYGASNNNSSFFSLGGIGGTGGTGGNFRTSGGPGSVGTFTSNGGANDVSVGGQGGASFFGFGGISPGLTSGTGSVPGNNALGYGGGGSGGASRTVNTNGGNGFPGYVIITEYL